MATPSAPPRPQRRTRKPTCRPNYPIVLLAGVEKSGVSHAAARFTGSDLVGRSYWLEFGADTADYYGAIPGADYEIVEHDGTYRDLLAAIQWAAAQPRGDDGRPNALILDNISELWEMLGQEQTLISQQRAHWRARRAKQPDPHEDEAAEVTSEQWIRAKDRWGRVMSALRRHDGPVILCGRLDDATVYDSAGNATTGRHWKPRAERNLSAHVDAIMQFRAYGEVHLTGVHSLHPDTEKHLLTRYDSFSLQDLMALLGIEEAAPTRSYVPPNPAGYLRDYEREARTAAQQREQLLADPGPGPASRPEPARKAPEELPDAEDVAQAILNAMERRNARTALLAVRTGHGASKLQRVRINTPWGQMSADAAITHALDEVRAAEQRQQAGNRPRPTPPDAGPPPRAQDADGWNDPPPPPEDAAPPPEDDPGPAGEEAPEPTPQAAPARDVPSPDRGAADTTPVKKPPAKPPARRPGGSPRGGRATALQMLLREADVQAKLHFRSPMDHLWPVLREGATEPADVRSVIELSDYVVGQRPDVIALLRREGETATADAYAALGTAAPQPRIDRVFADCALLHGSG